MAFTEPRLTMAVCQFTGGACKKNCASAVADPSDDTTWQCRWIETLNLMSQVMQKMMDNHLTLATMTYPDPSEDKPKKR